VDFAERERLTGRPNSICRPPAGRNANGDLTGKVILDADPDEGRQFNGAGCRTESGFRQGR
jgi:hypothetical protein